MKVSRFCLPATVAALAVLGGCYAPQPTTLYRSDEVLSDEEYLEMARGWMDLSRANYGEWTSLSVNQRVTINQLWTKAHQEMIANGKISPGTRQALSAFADFRNTEKLVSFDAIASNPTPDMNGQLESWDRRRQGDSMIYNENLRALADEWSRFWLMERPGGTPYNTVNTSGRF